MKVEVGGGGGVINGVQRGKGVNEDELRYERSRGWAERGSKGQHSSGKVQTEVKHGEKYEMA